ncbi:hypothetical protein D3C81_1419200 [compost metagenome]
MRFRGATILQSCMSAMLAATLIRFVSVLMTSSTSRMPMTRPMAAVSTWNGVSVRTPCALAMTSRTRNRVPAKLPLGRVTAGATTLLARPTQTKTSQAAVAPVAPAATVTTSSSMSTPTAVRSGSNRRPSTWKIAGRSMIAGCCRSASATSSSRTSMLTASSTSSRRISGLPVSAQAGMYSATPH